MVVGNINLSDFLYGVERGARAGFETPFFDVRDSTVLLPSFPKSGNTWLRFILGNVRSMVDGLPEAASFQNIGYLAPEIRGNVFLSGAALAEHNPAFLKTHFPYVSGFQGYRSLLLVRHPYSVISSYYDYMRAARGRDVGDFISFCNHWRYGFPAWVNFHEAWVDKCSLLISYEGLLSETKSILLDVYFKLGIEVDPDLVERAIGLSSKNEMRSSLNEFGDPNNKNGFDFVKVNHSYDERTRLSEIVSELGCFDRLSVLCDRFGYSLES